MVDRVRSELLAKAAEASAEARAWEAEGALLCPPNSSALQFVAVAPPPCHALSAVQAGGAGGYASLRRHDTPAGATLRAALGAGPHCAQRAAAVEAGAGPLHTFEVHDRQSYINLYTAQV